MQLIKECGRFIVGVSSGGELDFTGWCHSGFREHAVVSRFYLDSWMR
jgi:hypothetical protein